MKIIQESIRDISNNFVELENLLDDVDYVVSVYAKTFEYSFDAEPFTIENLKNIFSDASQEIKGSLHVTSWNNAYEKISKYLSYATYLHGVKKDLLSHFKITSDDILQKRLNIFVDIIKKHITIPSQEIIEHMPTQPSYFGGFLMWGLCFILLHQGKGVIIYFETSD